MTLEESFVTVPSNIDFNLGEEMMNHELLIRIDDRGYKTIRDFLAVTKAHNRIDGPLYKFGFLVCQAIEEGKSEINLGASKEMKKMLI